MRFPRLLRVGALLVSAGALSLAALDLSSCNSTKDDSDFSVDDDDDVDDPVDDDGPERRWPWLLVRDEDDPCTFSADVTWLGATPVSLDGVTVEGGGSVPLEVTFTLDGVGAATSDSVVAVFGVGWKVPSFTGAPVGTEIDPNGTWTFVLSYTSDALCSSATRLSFDIDTSAP